MIQPLHAVKKQTVKVTGIILFIIFSSFAIVSLLDMKAKPLFGAKIKTGFFYNLGLIRYLYRPATSAENISRPTSCQTESHPTRWCTNHYR